MRKLFLLLILLLPVSALGQGIPFPGPGITVGASCAGSWTRNTPNNTTGSGLAISVTAGDLLTLFVSSSQGSTDPGTVTDDNSGGSNVWTKRKTVNSDRPSTQSIWTAKAGTTQTLNVTANTDAFIDQLHAVSFTLSGATFTETMDGTGCSGTSTQTCNLTTTVTNSLLLGFGDGSSSVLVGSGFTAIVENTANLTRIASEYKATSTIGTNAVALVETTQRSIVGIAIKPC